MILANFCIINKIVFFFLLTQFKLGRGYVRRIHKMMIRTRQEDRTQHMQTQGYDFNRFGRHDKTRTH